MISEVLIQRGGSKLEITRAIIESGLDIPIPNSAWLYYGQEIGSLRAPFNDMKKPVIVRGSHQNDYHGFIDVVPTKRDVNTWEELEKAVNYIYSAMETEAVKIHSEDWGQQYTPEVHILLQEQTTNIVGSMIRHPHEGTFRIQYYDIIGRQKRESNRENISYVKTYKSGDMFHITHVRDPENYHKNLISDDAIIQLIYMFKLLEESGIVDTNYAQQMEFGLNPLSFFQARPFKKFEEAKKFETPFLCDTKIPYMHASECFGITPEEGIEIKLVPLDSFGLQNEVIGGIDEYGILLAGKLYDTQPTKQRLGNLLFYGTETEEQNYLMHEDYRYIKRAKYSFASICPFNIKQSSLFYYNSEDFNIFEHSRIYSNGSNGIIIPTKYL